MYKRQTLYNLGPAPEPNLTVLWSAHLPENWKRFAAKVSCDTDALQYENDDVMRPVYGDDYAIACCVSAMRVGKDMQFFGARANLAKLVLLAINGGRDELKGDQVGPKMPVWNEEYLDYDALIERIDFYRPWLAKTYVNAMNIIHYMHDKYAYEKSQMALHDSTVRRLMAFGLSLIHILAGDAADVGALHLDGTLVHIVEPHQQVDHRGLAAAGGAHQGHPLAGFDFQVEVFNEGPVLLVGKSHFPDGHGALGVLEHPGVGAVGGLGLLFDELKHPPGAGQGVLQLGDHAGNLVKGLGVLVCVA